MCKRTHDTLPLSNFAVPIRVHNDPKKCIFYMYQLPKLTLRNALNILSIDLGNWFLIPIHIEKVILLVLLNILFHTILVHHKTVLPIGKVFYDRQ